MKPYRNQRLLDLAREADYCCSCGKPNDGTVVACHFNAIKYGKGTSQKAHDIVGFACSECHARADGRIDKHLTKVDRELLIYDCIYRTLLWLLETGRMVLK